MFEKFNVLIDEDDKISKDDLMIVLKEELTDVSVFDMMIISEIGRASCRERV